MFFLLLRDGSSCLDLAGKRYGWMIDIGRGTGGSDLGMIGNERWVESQNNSLTSYLVLHASIKDQQILGS